MTELTLIKDNDGIIDIQMNRPPVNALNLELVDALHKAIDLNTSNGAKGLILSGGEGIYSAGLDVKKLLEMNADEISVFFKSFWGLMAKISRSPIPIAAAITGHSPAGGAVLANFCDYRIAAKGSFKIGMNEVFVGLEVPRVIYKGFVKKIMDQRQGGRRSSMGYIGAKEIKDIQKNAKFVKITKAGFYESMVHSVIITGSAENYKL